MEIKYKIPLAAAFLINLNIITGAGIFINPRPLTQLAGSLGFTVYLLGGLILLPQILCLACLATHYPTSGGLYVYSKKHLHPFIGFISGWSFFVGKSVSAGLLIHIFVSFIQQKIAILSPINTLFLDFCLISFLIGINIAGAHVGGKIQWLIAVIKAIPIGFVLITGIIYFFSRTTQQVTITIPLSFLAAVPTAIYALVGFESTCAIAHLVKNPEKNLKKVIILPFLTVICINTLFQLGMYSVLGDTLSNGTAKPLYLYVTALVNGFPFLAHFLNMLVFVSVIGGAFGILTSNAWNLFTFAKDHHIPFSNLLTKVNNNSVAWSSLIVEGMVTFFILIISKNQIALQSMSIFSVFISFFLSALAALQLARKNHIPYLTPIAISALATGSYTLYLCIKNIMNSGISFSFISILLSGIIIAFVRKKRVHV